MPLPHQQRLSDCSSPPATELPQAAGAGIVALPRTGPTARAVLYPPPSPSPPQAVLRRDLSRQKSQTSKPWVLPHLAGAGGYHLTSPAANPALAVTAVLRENVSSQSRPLLTLPSPRPRFLPPQTSHPGLPSYPGLSSFPLTCYCDPLASYPVLNFSSSSPATLPFRSQPPAPAPRLLSPVPGTENFLSLLLVFTRLLP